MTNGYPYEVRMQRIYFGKNPTNQRVTIFNESYQSKKQAEAMAAQIFRDAIEKEGASVYNEGCSVLNNTHSFVQTVHMIDHSEHYPINP